MPCIVFQAKDFAVVRQRHWSRSRRKAFTDLRHAVVSRVAVALAAGEAPPQQIIERISEPTDHTRYPFRSERTWMMAVLVTTGPRRTYVTVVYFGLDDDRRFKEGGLIDILHGENVCKVVYDSFIKNGVLVIEENPASEGEPVDAGISVASTRTAQVMRVFLSYRRGDELIAGRLESIIHALFRAGRANNVIRVSRLENNSAVNCYAREQVAVMWPDRHKQFYKHDAERVFCSTLTCVSPRVPAKALPVSICKSWMEVGKTRCYRHARVRSICGISTRYINRDMRLTTVDGGRRTSVVPLSTSELGCFT